MIYKDATKEVVAIYLPKSDSRRRTLVSMYSGDRLFWQSVRSCFGRGWWIEDKPWVDNDIWKERA